ITMPNQKKAPVLPLPPAGKPPAIFWRRAKMRHTFPFEPRCMLAHYDAQSKEGSGVAVATGWQAAGHILGAAQ
ncbi:hypothetical protein, partial [Aeromonas allosaccharophila]|uniref:hypothetical protein n=1 Tax=Aeromonas allosaccharophila TaxID=656 RepID=UPI003D209DD9